MGIQDFLIKLKFKEMRTLSEVGGISLTAGVFTLEPASDPEKSVRVNYKQLPAPSHSEELLSVAAASKETGLSKKTIQKLIKNNKVEAFKVGREWAIRRTSLQDYVEKMKEGHIDNSTNS